MKRILLFVFGLAIAIQPVQAANEWRGGAGENTILGAEAASDIDTKSYQDVVDPLDRLLAEYRRGTQLEADSVSAVTIKAGELVCSNTAGTIRKMRRNTSDISVGWSDIDTGAESSSTTHFLYADCDADATTFVGKISANTSTPTGVTSYLRLGKFYNDSSSNIIRVQDDDFVVGVAAYIVFNAVTDVIVDSMNVSSLTDNGAGDKTITWDTDFADTSYAVFGSSNEEGNVNIHPTTGKTAGAVRIRINKEDGAQMGYETNCTAVTVVAVGRQ